MVHMHAEYVCELEVVLFPLSSFIFSFSVTFFLWCDGDGKLFLCIIASLKGG